MAKRKPARRPARPRKASPATRSDYDSPWKEALDRYFEQCLAFFFPLIHVDIDWSRPHESLDNELRQVVRKGKIGRRYVDKLVKVWLRTGEETWLLIHVEVQVRKEKDFARRMYVYNYRIFDRYDKEVISVAILADDDPKWKPKKFGYARWGFETGTKFPIAKLLDYASNWEILEADRNPFAVVVLTHLKTLETRDSPGDRRAWKVRLVKGLYERGYRAEDVRQLFRFIDWIMDLPPGLDQAFLQEVHEYEEEKGMQFITTPERLGIAQGRRDGIRSLLKVKFGDEGLALFPEIEEIHDYVVLKEVLDVLETATTLDEVRRVYAPKPPKKKRK